MTNIVVRYLEGDRLTATVRGHEVTVDQPVADGGEDLAPTPTELFVSGLAACVGFYAERYLRRHDLDPSGLVVECDFDFSADGPARVGEIRITVTAPGLPDVRREPFARVIERCTVHNSLVQAPTVTIDLARSAKAACVGPRARWASRSSRVSGSWADARDRANPERRSSAAVEAPTS